MSQFPTSPSVVRGRFRFTDQVTFSESPALPGGSIANTHVQAGAPGNFIEATKLQQHFVITGGQESDATAAAEERPIHVAHGDGAVLAISAGVIDPNVGDSTITVDITKNGTSVLDSPITLNSSHTARQVIPGVLDAAETAYDDGDVFEVVFAVTAGSGTLGKGVFVSLVLREEPF
jgi:hypothetical protein